MCRRRVWTVSIGAVRWQPIQCRLWWLCERQQAPALGDLALREYGCGVSLCKGVVRKGKHLWAYGCNSFKAYGCNSCAAVLRARIIVVRWLASGWLARPVKPGRVDSGVWNLSTL